jgi:Tfp pilus assembly protein PilF
MPNMKPEKWLSRGVPIFFCILFVFILLIGCSTASTFSWFKFWDSPRVSSEIKDNDVIKFVSTIRPTRGNPDSHYLLATYYQKKGMHKEAIEEFKKIIAIDPLYKKAYNGLGVSYDQLGYFSEAIESYQTALGIDPKLDYVLNNLGYTYLKQGNYKAAVKALEQAAALDSHNIRIRGNLELAYDRSGQYEKTLREFKAAGNETTAYYNEGERPNLTSPESNSYQPQIKDKEGEGVSHTDYEKPLSARRGNDNASKIHSQEEGLNLFISQIISQDSNVQEMVNTSRGNEFRKENLIQSEKLINSNSPNKFGIEISNGNGVSRMAKRLGKYLNEKGYHVVRLTNARNFNYPKTVISYQMDYENEAHGVEQQIPGNCALEKVVGHERPHVKIKILIGKDIVKYNNIFKES